MPGSTRIYAVTTVDNSNNTVNQTAREAINSVNQDGSFTYTEDNPNNNAIVVNGAPSSIEKTVFTAESDHHTLSSTTTSSTGIQTTCIDSPHGSGAPSPMYLGETWTLNFTETCGANPAIAHVQNGTIVGVESLTVPAGTFSTLKIQSTITWTDANGTTHTQTATNWRDIATGFSVKRVEITSYSGTVPSNGYPISVTRVLQSVSAGVS